MDILFANTAGGKFGAKFDAFIDETLPECSIANVANLVRVAGKRSRDNTVSHLIRRLPDIACQLELLSSSAWEYKEISFILYGTQSCKESNDGYLRIMMTMSKIATKTLLTSETITSQNLAMALYGLRSNKFEGKGSKEMLSCLPRIVDKCTEPLGGQNVGNALYGLQGMSSDNADVLSLVRALSGQVARCKEPLDAQEVGNALYGLQGMSSDNADVLSLVRAISGQVARCMEALDAQEVGNALYGLQNMSSDNADVLSLVRALSGQVAGFKEQLSAQAVGNALYVSDNGCVSIIIYVYNPCLIILNLCLDTHVIYISLIS